MVIIRFHPKESQDNMRTGSPFSITQDSESLRMVQFEVSAPANPVEAIESTNRIEPDV